MLYYICNQVCERKLYLLLNIIYAIATICNKKGEKKKKGAQKACVRTDALFAVADNVPILDYRDTTHSLLVLWGKYWEHIT